jgi:hypothetical protein
MLAQNTPAFVEKEQYGKKKKKSGLYSPQVSEDSLAKQSRKKGKLGQRKLLNTSLKKKVKK